MIVCFTLLGSSDQIFHLVLMFFNRDCAAQMNTLLQNGSYFLKKDQTGRDVPADFLQKEVQIFVIHLIPVCPPGMKLSTNQSRAITCALAAITVRTVLCSPMAK